MSIGTVNGTGPVTSLQNDLRSGGGSGSASGSTSAGSSKKSADVPSPQIDEVTMQPKPPRFPWLSRLSQQLESASKQRPSFKPAPELGDNLDQTA